MAQDMLKGIAPEASPWRRHVTPLLVGLLGCILVMAISGAGTKNIAVALVLLTAMVVLLALGKNPLLRTILLWGLGISLVLGPNFFFHIVAVKMTQFAGVGGYGVALTDLATISLVALVVFHRDPNQPVRMARPSRHVLLVAGLYLFWVLLSLNNAQDISLGLAQTFFECKYVLLFLLLGYAALPSRKSASETINNIMIGIAAGVLIEAVVSAAEYARLIGGTVSFMGITVGGFLETFQGGLVENRIGGTFRHPNYLAEALVLLWPSLLAAAMTAKSRLRLYFGLALLAALGTLLLTLSRGGWVGGAAAGLLFILLTLRQKNWREILRRNRKTILAVAAIGAILLVVFSGPVITKLTRSDPRNIKARADLNRLAVYMIDLHPMLGVGILNSNIASEGSPIDHVYRRAAGMPPVIHNVYLLIAAEIGIPGLAIFLWLVALVLITGWRACPRARDPVKAQFLSGLTAGLFGFLVADFFGPGLRKMELAYLFWCLMGLLTFLAHSPDRTEP